MPSPIQKFGGWLHPEHHAHLVRRELRNPRYFNALCSVPFHRAGAKVPHVSGPYFPRLHPVFLNPAEIPLMVAAMARFTSGVSSPPRLRRSISTWIKCIGST